MLRRAQPGPVAGFVVRRDAVLRARQRDLVIPLGLVPSWLALASTGFDVALLGVAVAMWDAFDEGQALRADMLRSFVATAVVARAVRRPGSDRPGGTGETALTVLLFTSLAIAIAINVLADPLAGLLDRLAFSRSPDLRADRAALRSTEAALPLRSANPLDGVDEDTFARLTRRALGHYGDLSKLVASPLTALPMIDERLAGAARPTSRWSGPTNSRRCWPTASPASSRATAATSAPPSSGATTTRCTSRTSSACAPTRRTPPPPGSTRWPGRPGSGSSPRCRNARCTTGRTPRPGSSPPICAAIP